MTAADVPPPPMEPTTQPVQYASTPMKPQTAKPTVGGALLMVAGILALINFVMLIAAASIVGGAIPVPVPGFEGLASILVICGVIGLIFSLVSILGGVMAIRRKSWGIALVGAIFGLLTIGFLFTSSLLALIGLILIAISKDEFD